MTSRETDIEAREVTAWLKYVIVIATMQQITVKYSKTPPQVFVSHMRQFVTENQDSPPGCHLSLKWEEAPKPPGTRADTSAPREQGKLIDWIISSHNSMQNVV